MEFEISSPWKVGKGTFVCFGDVYRAVAQIFVPSDPGDGQQFSFFWRGQARRYQIHDLLAQLLRPQSDIKARLIGRSYISNFGFSLTNCSPPPPEHWHFELIHRLIDQADLPASLGLTIDTRDGEAHPSSVYVWASIDSDERIGRVDGNPELGVRISLLDWHRPMFKDAMLPLLANTAKLDQDEALELWSRASL